jgi:hypothetical protein
MQVNSSRKTGEKGGTSMSRVAVYHLLASVLVLALAVSAGVASVFAKETKAVVKTNITLFSAHMLAGTELKAGNYEVIADESKVTVKQGRKVVAEANAQWMDGKDKALDTSLVTDGDNIREIHFGGKSRYVVIR